MSKQSWAKQPSQVARFSEYLRYRGAWMTEEQKEEALDDPPLKKREWAAVNQTNI